MAERNVGDSGAVLVPGIAHRKMSARRFAADDDLVRWQSEPWEFGLEVGDHVVDVREHIGKGCAFARWRVRIREDVVLELVAHRDGVIARGGNAPEKFVAGDILVIGLRPAPAVQEHERRHFRARRLGGEERLVEAEIEERSGTVPAVSAPGVSCTFVRRVAARRIGEVAAESDVFPERGFGLPAWGRQKGGKVGRAGRWRSCGGIYRRDGECGEHKDTGDVSHGLLDGEQGSREVVEGD